MSDRQLERLTVALVTVTDGLGEANVELAVMTVRLDRPPGDQVTKIAAELAAVPRSALPH